MSKLVVAQRQMTVAAIWPFLVAHPPPRAPVAIGSRGNWIAEYLMMTKTKNLCCSDNQIIYEGVQLWAWPGPAHTTGGSDTTELRADATEILQFGSKVSKNG